MSLTIFTIPKAFEGVAAIHQRNAIESWRRLEGAQVVLCGNDHGVAEAAAELACDHYPELRRTELGTPLLDDAFRSIEHIARRELICFVNADILLLAGFEEVLRQLRPAGFLVAGRRLNLTLDNALAFEDATWGERLWERAQREGDYAKPAGSDYFIYRRGTLGAIPPFAVGRPFWDNWMLFRARQLGWPLIDGTSVIRAIHQNHDYAHVPNAVGGMWEGPEADANFAAADGRVYTLMDATHRLTPSGMKSIVSVKNYARRLHRVAERLPGWDQAKAVYRRLRR